MDDINLFSIIYLSFRLAPFILVSVFTLSSVINQDIKGVIYLAGLLFTCAFVILSGKLLTMAAPNWFQPNSGPEDLLKNVTKVCNLMTLSKSGPMSVLPLSQVVFSYTLFYIVYAISIANSGSSLIASNLPSLIIFPILIFSDLWWSASNGCATSVALLSATVLGGAGCLLWGYIISTGASPTLLYTNGLTNREVCSIAAKQKFACKISNNKNK